MIPAVSGFLRSWVAVTQPSRRGIITSRVITSGLDLGHLVQAVAAVDGREHLEALQGQVDRDELPDDLVIVDNQHAAESLCHAREATRSPPSMQADRADPPARVPGSGQLPLRAGTLALASLARLVPAALRQPP